MANFRRGIDSTTLEGFNLFFVLFWWRFTITKEMVEREAKTKTKGCRSVWARTCINRKGRKSTKYWEKSKGFGAVHC